jgi:hypothetical protein
MSVLPAALPTYEQLRAEVLNGHARPEGLTAVAYHGMLRGLTLILTEVSPEAAAALPAVAPVAEETPLDREFLRLVANMLLQSQSQVMHVY